MTVLPPRPFLDTILVRVALLWAVLRAVSGGGAAAAGIAFPEALTGPPYTTLWLVAVILVALRVDMGRRAELVLLANLGHSFRRIAVLAAGASATLDLGLRALLA